MKNLSPAAQRQLPTDVRALRPKPLPVKFHRVEPGRFAYFGIQSTLNIPGTELFDPKMSSIHLTINIDGLPLFRSSGISLWPILGRTSLQHSVFIIGIYEGIAKPQCSNAYIKLLVEEICQLRERGISIRGQTYRFLLDKILMDAPAKSYMLGVKGHTGYASCTKCRVQGKRVLKGGGPGRVMTFLDLDAESQTAEDFKLHVDLHRNDPHYDQIIGSSDAVLDSENYEDDPIDEDFEKDDDALLSLGENLSADLSQHGYHQHPTLLASIPQFDMVTGIPLDYMHLICLGVMKKLLLQWIDRRMLSPNAKKIISQRLRIAKEWCPQEIHRKPEIIEHIARWKATQFRTFLLYIGAVVMHGRLPEAYLQHFNQFVFAMRCAAKKVPHDKKRSARLLQISKVVRKLLRVFVQDSIALYGEEFVVHNVHNLIHVADDYARFGPVDEYSCFPFESFLGRLEKYIRSGNKPLEQVINQYSYLLLTQQFANAPEPWDHVLEYYERPQLHNKIDQLCDDGEDEDQRKMCNEGHFEMYSKMYFKNFVLRTDNIKDSYCCISTQEFVQISKILKNRLNGEIFIFGKQYTSVTSLFHHPSSSRDVGIVICSNLSTRATTYALEKISDKCFALPFERTDWSDDSGSMAIVRYLH